MTTSKDFDPALPTDPTPPVRTPPEGTPPERDTSKPAGRQGPRTDTSKPAGRLAGPGE